MEDAFKYAKKFKMEAEESYPYHAKDGKKCKYSEAKGVIDLVSSYKEVKPKDPTQLMAALAIGPVSIAVDGAAPEYQSYESGILKKRCGHKLDHGNLLVGTGTEGSTDYWIVKNSWGESWGEKGYIRIERDMNTKGPGLCGLQAQPTYPIF